MLDTKLACPFCRATLKSKTRVPAGTALQCPKCRGTFRVGTGDPAIKTAPPAPPPVPSAPVPPFRPARRPSDFDPPIARSSGQGKRIALVVGGLIFLSLLGTSLAIVVRTVQAPSEPPGETEPADFVLKPLAPIPPRPTTRPLIVLTPEEEDQVRKMSDRGIDWLRNKQAPDGSWSYPGWPGGITAMGGLTLLSCGVDAKDPAVQKAAERVRATAPSFARTYELALTILFLDKLAEDQDAKLMETLVLRLIAGQSQNGGWDYGCPTRSEADQQAMQLALTRFQERSISLLDENAAAGQEEITMKIVQELPPHLRGVGAFTKPSGKVADFFRMGGDNSNTQFAVLALWAARKHKLPVDRSLELAVRRFKESQKDNGSWTYKGHGHAMPHPSMTCAGLLALAVEYGVRDKEKWKGARPEDNPAIKMALEHVSRSLDAPKDPRAKTAYPPLYFMWSVERVGMLFQIENIAGKDWYRWGMRILNDHQTPDGHWRQGWHASNDVADTCFALLFLNRVNLTTELSQQLRRFDAP